MYHVLTNKVETYKGKILRAMPDIELDGKCSPRWWSGKPFKRKPREFVYSVLSGAPMPDYLNGTGMMPLCSKKLIELFEINGVKFEAFRAKVLDYNSKLEIDSDYYVFHLLEIFSPGIDLEQAVISRSGNFVKIERIEISLEAQNKEPIMYFPKELAPNMLVHQKMVDEIMKSNITGVEFVALDKFIYGI